jgi:hypothetical protein
VRARGAWLGGWLGFAIVCAALTGLSCEAPRATINDVGRGRARIIAVDGQPVERAQSKYVTMVPVALVKPGPHTFRVVMRADESGAPEETLLVWGTVAARKHYRFDESGGTVQLEEVQAER